MYASNPWISLLCLVNDNEVHFVNLFVTFSHKMINDAPGSRLVVSAMSTQTTVAKRRFEHCLSVRLSVRVLSDTSCLQGCQQLAVHFRLHFW